MGLSEQLSEMMEMQKSFDKCSVCNRTLPPGTPSNKLYDMEIGSITVCVDCSTKAIMWYVRKLHGLDTKM